MLNDAHSRVIAIQNVQPDDYGGSGGDGVVIDTAAHGSLEYLVNCGEMTTASNFLTIIKESDTGAFGGEETPILDEDIFGPVPMSDTSQIDAKQFENSSFVVQLRVRKRFAKLSFFIIGSGVNEFGSVAMLGFARHSATADQIT